MNLSASDYRCYRHPDREAYISCQRCERLICPECMKDASVGFQCPSCVVEGAKSVRTARTIAGGAVQNREGIVTMVLIGINVAVFVLTYVLQIRAVTNFGGMIGVSARDTDGTVLQGVADGGYWRLLTSAFLHQGVLHIAFNMYALYLFGPFVERALGTVRYIGAYLMMSIVSGTFVYVLSAPTTFTVGASGAVFGLFGMALILLLKAKQDVRSLLVLLAINAAISTQAAISWEGHLGGFVAGCVLGATFAYVPRDRRTLVQVAVFVILTVGVVGTVAARTVSLTA